MILVDNLYFGRLMRRARATARLKRTDAAKMMRITKEKLHRYETGKELIPEFVIERLFYNGWSMLAARSIPYRKNPKFADVI